MLVNISEARQQILTNLKNIWWVKKKKKTTEREREHETSLQVRGEVECKSDAEELVEYLLAVAKPLAAFVLDEFLNPLICFAKDTATLLELIITNLCFQSVKMWYRENISLTSLSCWIQWLIIIVFIIVWILPHVTGMNNTFPI